MGFPLAVGLIIVLGVLIVFVARDRRNADAFPQANKDHVHSSIDIYTCVTQDEANAAASTTTTSSTTTTTTTPPSTSSGETTTTTAPTTTVPSTSTTVLAPDDAPGEYQAAPTDAQADELGIHTHGDGLIHIHPFKDSSAGRNATLGVFLDQVGISMTDNALSLAGGTKTFTEGTTKCAGGKDGVVQVAKWDHANEAAAGADPNQIFTSGFDKIRLGADNSFVLAFMPQGSKIKAKSDVEQRIANVTDVNPTASSTTVPASGAPESGAPSSSTPASSDQSSTTTTPPASSSSTSSSSP
jgi:hypothetical protein